MEEIQRAYRDKSRKHHPDLGGDEWAFRMVVRAYEILKTTGGIEARHVSPSTVVNGSGFETSLRDVQATYDQTVFSRDENHGPFAAGANPMAGWPSRESAFVHHTRPAKPTDRGRVPDGRRRACMDPFRASR